MDFLILPFVACLILVGLHTYFGIHIIQRGVIFVDLALAQVAALGGILGLFLGFPMGSWESYFCSLSLSLGCGALFTSFRSLSKTLPTEALIGVVYAMAAATSILILNFLPADSHVLKDMLVGRLLFVSAGDLLHMGITYLAVGILLVIFHQKFFDYKMDLIFYGAFSLLVTSSVAIAGVLLVFTFLIIPSLVSSLFYSQFNKRLLLGWAFGLLGSSIGLFASYFWDLPTGAAIVVCFGILGLFTWLCLRLWYTFRS